MFSWLKKLFGVKEEQKPVPSVQPETKAPDHPETEKKMLEKACAGCGRPVFYDPAWTHIPNYCKECRAKFDAEKGVIRRKCKRCGKSFTVPENVQHMPNYCRDCRAKFKTHKPGAHKA